MHIKGLKALTLSHFVFLFGLISLAVPSVVGPGGNTFTTAAAAAATAAAAAAGRLPTEVEHNID